MMADCSNEDEQFDILSETDSSDETQILKIEHHAKCFIAECKESFTRIDKLYDHVDQSHYPLRFQCKECLLYTDKYHVILGHKILQHIGSTHDLFHCFYCSMYSSVKLSELVDHLMTCIISNNDRDGHKMAKFMKSLAAKDDKNKEKEGNEDGTKFLSHLRVDNKTGQVSFHKKRVVDFPDHHSPISAKRRVLHNALSNLRSENHKIYDSYTQGVGRSRTNLLAPTGNLHSFLFRTNQFSRMALRKRKETDEIALV